jgi:hypothetical protein
MRLAFRDGFFRAPREGLSASVFYFHRQIFLFYAFLRSLKFFFDLKF